MRPGELLDRVKLKRRAHSHWARSRSGSGMKRIGSDLGSGHESDYPPSDRWDSLLDAPIAGDRMADGTWLLGRAKSAGWFGWDQGGSSPGYQFQE
ncbi:hypothetical protein V6N12_076339 [Hibiscus sabdariffa]|uniref:Uncharacterized protein n=1 Tax=Hibiscus sabdariffa TaxID=183260 RepID=A0ABR2D9W6_9ROSI